jgi:hypothetical protein
LRARSELTLLAHHPLEPLQDFARQIQQVQPQLLRFARTQLRNDA